MSPKLNGEIDAPKTLKGLMIRLSNDITDGEQMRGQSSQNLVFVLSHGVQTLDQHWSGVHEGHHRDPVLV